MDPFYCITTKIKSRSRLSKGSVSDGNDSKRSGECSSKTVGDSVHCIAKRTRSRAAVISGTASIGKNSKEGRTVPLEGCSSRSRKRKGHAGDGGKDWASPELGRGGSKWIRDGDEEQCRGRGGGGGGGGGDEGTSDSDSIENSDLGRKADSGLSGVKDHSVVQKGALKKFVSIDLDETQSSGDGSGKNDNSVEEDFGMKKSDREPSSSSTGDEDEENTSDAKISSEKNDRALESSDFDSGKTDDSEDEDFERTRFYREPSSSSIGDKDKEDTPDSKIARERTVSQTKRKRYSDIDDDTPHSVHWGNCVAQRTRSRTSSSSKNKTKKKLGTFSRPICFDLDEDYSSTENDEDDEEDDGTSSNDDRDDGSSEVVPRNDTYDNNSNYNGAQNEDEEDEEDEEETRKSTKRKRVQAPKDDDQIFTALLNSIWEKGKGEVFLESLRDPEQEIHQPVVETKLPLKFNFGIKQPIPEEKSDHEKEIDRLFAEMAFALNSNEIGSFGSSHVDDENTDVPDTQTDQGTLCGKGKHELIMEDTIGIRCMFCSFVQLEIKYILPPWGGRQSSERYGQQVFSGEGDNAYLLEELDFQDDGGASQYSHTFAEGTVWDITPGLRKRMYPHQCEGFEFMWKNIAGSIELETVKKCTNSDGVSGCVISHAPGTGKTFLTIAFLQAYMKVDPDCRPIIIAPRSILLTWEEEFKKWKIDIPFHNLNNREFSGKETSIVLGLAQRCRSVREKETRILKLYSWSTQMSILGISYTLFEKLAGENFSKGVPDTLSKEMRKILLEKPKLLILDEGHTPRNKKSCIWKVLSKIKIPRRIILSGTPFQNNFQELYNILCLVRPQFTDVIKSKGKWSSLTSSIGKSSDDGLQELRGMLDPFVHVHRGTILKDNLPGLRNWTIYLRPTSLQKELLQSVKRIPNTFELEHLVALVSVHPSLLMSIKHPLFGKADSFAEENNLDRMQFKPNEGVKTRFLMELVRLIEPTKERVLVFSQYIKPLKFIKEQLRFHFGWIEGEEVLQMDGKNESEQRQSSINLFNDPSSNARILLASTKACSEGIHLIGASRVVLLDIVWNPSVEWQAISRAYRLGQKRFVYTYHLITSGTMEEEKYKKQVEKERISKLVFSSRHTHGERMSVSSRVPDDDILGEMVQHNKLKDIFEMIFQRD